MKGGRRKTPLFHFRSRLFLCFSSSGFSNSIADRSGFSASSLITNSCAALMPRSRSTVSAADLRPRTIRRTALSARDTSVGLGLRLGMSDPGGFRTHDLRIKSPLLYQLSYRVGL